MLIGIFLVPLIPSTNVEAATISKGQAVVNEAYKYIGRPYVYGATGPNSFDCSGLTQYVYSKFWVNLSRTSQAQFSNGSAVNRNNLAAGDLVFFNTNTALGHVGIYIGNGDFIHAPSPGSFVRINSINESYYNTRYAGARRVISGNTTTATRTVMEDAAFDYIFYAFKYPDLKEAFGLNEEALYDHWLYYGIKEGRCASTLFDVRYYLENSKDLQDAFGKIIIRQDINIF